MPHRHTPVNEPPDGTSAQSRVTGTASSSAPASSSPVARTGAWATAWNALSAVIGAAMGLLPHLLHHLGLFAGAVLVTGAGGNLAFGALGLLLSVPLLRRLHRRFGTWKAPAVAVAVFAVMFSVSAFVLGPAISGDPSEPPTPTPVPGAPPTPSDHATHHGR